MAIPVPSNRTRSVRGSRLNSACTWDHVDEADADADPRPARLDQGRMCLGIPWAPKPQFTETMEK